MPLRTLKEFSEKHEGFKITGRLEYDDQNHEVTCHLTAKAKGFEDICKSSPTYSGTLSNIKYQIHHARIRDNIAKRARGFLLIPLDGDGVFSGEVELCAKTNEGWASLEEPNETLLEVGKAWEIYNHLWVPVPTDKKTLTKPQIKKLDKLTEQARDVAVEFILTKAKEILEK